MQRKWDMFAWTVTQGMRIYAKPNNMINQL